MFGKCVVYIFVREEGVCHKLGITEHLEKRFNTLNKKYGPFNLEKSIILRADDKNEAGLFETMIKHLYCGYNCPLPIERPSNGETEWYASVCYEEMLKSLINLAESKHGKGIRLGKVPVKIVENFSEPNIIKQDYYRKLINSNAARINVLCQNTLNAKEFKKLINSLFPMLIGVTKSRSDLNHDSYEMFLRCDASEQLTESIFNISKLSADNDNTWAHINICTSMEYSYKYKKMDFSVPKKFYCLEQGWESKNKLFSFYSLLEDLARSYPVPPAYEQYVGVSLFDSLTNEEKQNLSDVLWDTIFPNE